MQASGREAFARVAKDMRAVDTAWCGRRKIIEVNDRQLRADIYLPQMVVGGVGRGLCIDVSRVHDFHGNAANPSQNGTLRHADLAVLVSSCFAACVFV